MKKISNSTIIVIIFLIIFIGLVCFFIFCFKDIRSYVDNWENAYNVLRDVILIVVTIFTIFFGLTIAMGGWILRTVLIDDLKSELHNFHEEWKHELFSEVNSRLSTLLGRIYDEGEENRLYIEFAYIYAKRAVEDANKLNEGKYYPIKIKILNTYLMVIAVKRDKCDITEAYDKCSNAERLLYKYRKKINIEDKQNYEETIYFFRACLPRDKSNDKEYAIKKFYELSDNIDFAKWEEKWKRYKLI